MATDPLSANLGTHTPLTLENTNHPPADAQTQKKMSTQFFNFVSRMRQSSSSTKPPLSSSSNQSSKLKPPSSEASNTDLIELSNDDSKEDEGEMDGNGNTVTLTEIHVDRAPSQTLLTEEGSDLENEHKDLKREILKKTPSPTQRPANPLAQRSSSIRKPPEPFTPSAYTVTTAQNNPSSSQKRVLVNTSLETTQPPRQNLNQEKPPSTLNTKPNDDLFHTIESHPVLAGAAVAALTNLIFANTFFKKINFCHPALIGAGIATHLPSALSFMESKALTNQKVSKIALPLIELMKTPTGQALTIGFASQLVDIVPYGTKIVSTLSALSLAYLAIPILYATFSSEIKSPPPQTNIPLTSPSIIPKRLSADEINYLFTIIKNKQTLPSILNPSFQALLTENSYGDNVQLGKTIKEFYQKNKTYFDSRLDKSITSQIEGLVTVVL